jgi:hypothetical protein
MLCVLAFLPSYISLLIPLLLLLLLFVSMLSQLIADVTIVPELEHCSAKRCVRCIAVNCVD